MSHDSELIKVLQALASETDEAKLVELLKNSSQFQDRRLLEAVSPLLEAPSSDVRAAAYQLIKVLPDRRSVPFVEKAFSLGLVSASAYLEIMNLIGRPEDLSNFMPYLRQLLVEAQNNAASSWALLGELPQVMLVQFLDVLWEMEEAEAISFELALKHVPELFKDRILKRVFASHHPEILGKFLNSQALYSYSPDIASRLADKGLEIIDSRNSALAACGFGLITRFGKSLNPAELETLLKRLPEPAIQKAVRCWLESQDSACKRSKPEEESIYLNAIMPSLRNAPEEIPELLRSFGPVFERHQPLLLELLGILSTSERLDCLASVYWNSPETWLNEALKNELERPEWHPQRKKALELLAKHHLPEALPQLRNILSVSANDDLMFWALRMLMRYASESDPYQLKEIVKAGLMACTETKQLMSLIIDTQQRDLANCLEYGWCPTALPGKLADLIKAEHQLTEPMCNFIRYHRTVARCFQPVFYLQHVIAWREELCDIAASVWPEEMANLSQPWLWEEDPYKQASALLLQQPGAKPDVQARVLELLNSPVLFVQKSAFKALSMLRIPNAWPTLEQALNQGELDTRYEVLVVVRELEIHEAIPALEAMRTGDFVCLATRADKALQVFAGENPC